MHIEFSTGFDRVNHHRIHYKLCSKGILRSVLSILTELLRNRPQYVKWTLLEKLVNLVQECLLEVLQARYCSSCTPCSLFPYWRLSLSAMQITPLWWLAVVLSQDVRVAVEESLNSGLSKVNKLVHKSELNWLKYDKKKEIKELNDLPLIFCLRCHRDLCPHVTCGKATRTERCRWTTACLNYLATWFKGCMNQNIESVS